MTEQLDPTNFRVPLAVSGVNPAVKLLRGRSTVYVNGVEVAIENRTTSGSGANPVSGSVTIGVTSYAITGTVDSGTGAYTISASPALPVNTIVTLSVFIDYEAQPALAPIIGLSADVYSLFANPTRGRFQASIDAETQMRNEAQIDAASQALLGLRNQYACERHYAALRKMKDAAVNNTLNFDFNFAAQIAQKTTAQMVSELAYALERTSQNVAIASQGTGITHIYVTGLMAARFAALPTDYFRPSGIMNRPGIFRLGTFLGKYEIMYTPKVLVEGATTTQLLCVGRATDPARNPYVMGDAVPPIFVPLAVDYSLRNGSAFYTRNFSRVNPHAPSAKSCALVTLTNTL
jgi:hypothetical protein